jgi:F-type H+-transporting ATPase subunit epsilon
VDGEIGVYATHTAFTAPAVTGVLRVKDHSGKWREAFMTEGILEVKDHKTVLIVDAAEWPEEIDGDRARASKTEAEADLNMGLLKFEIDNAKAKLRRAEFRLKVCETNKVSNKQA